MAPGSPRRARRRPAGPELRSGCLAVAPMLLGVAPFGVVAGATPVANGMPWDVSVGFSTVVFAGASQLVAIDLLARGGSVLVAVVAACTVNLRLVLYSASIAPHIAGMPLRRRLGMAYLLTDQVYALSIVRWAGDEPPVAGDADAAETDRRDRSHWWFYLGAALALWVTWQISTVVGLLVGNALPSGIHLEFAVPLVFLVLLVPTLVDRPSVVAAVAGGAGAVLAAQVGAGAASVVVGSVVGILGGVAADRSGGAATRGPTAERGT